MPHFILQTDQDGLLQEFPNAVRNSCSYQNWYHSYQIYHRQESSWTYELCSDPTQIPIQRLSESVPVGTIEFCEQILKMIGKEPLIPALNIPVELEKYARRKIWRNCSKEDIKNLLQGNKKLFIKQQDRNKGFSDIVCHPDHIPEDMRFFVSEIIDVDAEWRVFFDRGKIVDAKPYILDKWVAPNREEVEEMLRVWKDQPPAGTIDIMIGSDGRQHLLECHLFVSVGLYGLDEADVAPMALRAWRGLIRGKK